MREYWDWEKEDSPLKIRIHRRVLAGIEREGAGAFDGILLGAASTSTREVLVEDFVRIIPGDDLDRLEQSFAGQGPLLLSTVGYFRADPAAGAQITDDDREFLSSHVNGQPRVLLLLRSGGDIVHVVDVLVAPSDLPLDRAVPPAATHRVLFRADAPPPEPPAAAPTQLPASSIGRILWPSLAIAAGLLIGAVAYLTLHDDKPRPVPPTESVRVAPPRDPMPGPPPAPPSQADRAVVEPRPKPAETPAQIQREVRDTISRWRAAMLKRDIPAYISLYAPSVSPYYTKDRVSRETISDEVHDITKRYGPIVVLNLKDITVAPIDATHAIANFRKMWVTSSNKFAGEERQQLKLARFDNRWLITSEQELKVIWVRKR